MYEKSHVNAIRHEGNRNNPVETDRDAGGVPHGVISALVYLAHVYATGFGPVRARVRSHVHAVDTHPV